MRHQKALTEILQTLYDHYKENPDQVYDIHPIAEKYSVSSYEMANTLTSLGLIRPDVLYSLPHQVYCTISIIGIYQFDADYIDQKTQEVIRGLGSSGGSGNISGYFMNATFHDEAAIDFARYLQKLGYVKGLLFNSAKKYIGCELTTEGWGEFKNNKQVNNGPE